MIWRRSDWPGISTDHPSTCLPQHKIGGRWEYVYDSLDALPSRWTGPLPPPLVYGKLRREDRERAAKIIAAIGEWQAANGRSEDAAGYTAACEASDGTVARHRSAAPDRLHQGAHLGRHDCEGPRHGPALSRRSELGSAKVRARESIATASALSRGRW